MGFPEPMAITYYQLGKKSKFNCLHQKFITDIH